MDAPIIHEVPKPWRQLPVYAIGGLFQVGYASGTDLLLVLSHQGRGVFDCNSGEKIARDHTDAYNFFDPIRLMAEGFGPLAGQTIRMAGLFGGGLTLTTLDGWGLEVQARVWPTHSVFLSAPGTREPVCIGEDGVCEMRACGFSETGRSFVIATSCDLTIYVRSAEFVSVQE
jgi:hypothetical protein